MRAVRKKRKNSAYDSESSSQNGTQKYVNSLPQTTNFVNVQRCKQCVKCGLSKHHLRVDIPLPLFRSASILNGAGRAAVEAGQTARTLPIPDRAAGYERNRPLGADRHTASAARASVVGPELFDAAVRLVITVQQTGQRLNGTGSDVKPALLLHNGQR